jgi:pimeloyl-ACP methyl ester carboxylesterase
MAEQIPGAKIVFVDGIGHEIYVDKAKECFKELDSFLDSIRPN